MSLTKLVLETPWVPERCRSICGEEDRDFDDLRRIEFVNSNRLTGLSKGVAGNQESKVADSHCPVKEVTSGYLDNNDFSVKGQIPGSLRPRTAKVKISILNLLSSLLNQILSQ